MIRRATLADVPELSRLAPSFIAASCYCGVVSPTSESIANGFECLIDETVSTGVVFVAVVHGTVVGFLAGCESAPWFAWHERMACELGCWVSEQHRGGAVTAKLLRAFESWAASRKLGVVSVTRNGQTKMSRIPQPS